MNDWRRLDLLWTPNTIAGASQHILSRRGNMNPSLDDLVLPSGANLQDSELAQALHGRVGLLEAQEKVKLTGDLLSGSAKKKLVAARLARHAMQPQGWINADALSASTEWFAVQVQQD